MKIGRNSKGDLFRQNRMRLAVTESREEGEEEHTHNSSPKTLRLLIEKFIVSRNYGFYIDLLSASLCLFSTSVYVMTTYMTETLEWFEITDICISSFLVFEISLWLFIAQHRLNFLLQTSTVMDCIIVLFYWCFVFTNFYYAQSLVAISRILRFVKVARVFKKYAHISESNISRQILTIVLTILSLIYVSSGVLQVLELLDGHKYSFNTMIYFVIVTLSTVGYGEIVPKSSLGRGYVIFVISITLVLIPKQTSELINLMSLQSRYARNFYKANSQIPHIIITGKVKALALKNFCHELLHPDHGSQDINAVILQEEEPENEMEVFLHHPRFEVYLNYLQGNPMTERDMNRASSQWAKACILLTEKNTRDPVSADHKNILMGLAIKQYVFYEKGKNIRLCMQLSKPESKTQYYSSLNIPSNDQLIIIEEIKMNLLAKSCYSPGIIAMLSNLIASCGDEKPESKQLWLKEYAEGMGHEIYKINIHSRWEGKTFTSLAKLVYTKKQAIVFALEKTGRDEKPVVILNPGKNEIRNIRTDKVKAYLICPDKEIADEIAEIKPFGEENTHQPKAKWMMRNRQKGPSILWEEEDEEEENEEAGKDHSEYCEEDEFMMNENYFLDNGAGSCIKRETIEGSQEITEHIVVCGMHSSIFYFLKPLRARYLKQCKYIVIISNSISDEVWDQISILSKIVHISGSPKSHSDIVKTNIKMAYKAIILGNECAEMSSGSRDEMRDASTLFIYKAIKKCNPSLQVMCEIIQSNNIEYLMPTSQLHLEQSVELSPVYAAGEVYISSIIDTLTCQAYYNPHICTIIQQLLTGGSQQRLHEKQSNLWQIRVPDDLVNKMFKELFIYLLEERELVALGLYRLPDVRDNLYPYVYTNPPPNCRLTPKDRVYVLGHKISNDLLFSNLSPNKEDIDVQIVGEAPSPFSSTRCLPSLYPQLTGVEEETSMHSVIPTRTLSSLRVPGKFPLNVRDYGSLDLLLDVIKQLNKHIDIIEKEFLDVKDICAKEGQLAKQQISNTIHQQMSKLDAKKEIKKSTPDQGGELI